MNPSTINEIRAILGMSQGEMAAALGCSQRAVAYYESGNREVPADVADQLMHMRRTYLDTHTRLPVRRAIEDKVARPMPGLSVGCVPDGWLSLVEKCVVESVAAVPPPFLGRALAVRLTAPYGCLRLDVEIDPTLDGYPEYNGFRQWLRERAARLTEDSRHTCARCGGPGASIEQSGWAWPLCHQHAIKRKEIRDESRAA